MDIEDIFLPASFGNLAQGSGDILRFFARVGENDAFFILNAVIKVLVPGVDVYPFFGIFGGGGVPLFCVFVYIEVFECETPFAFSRAARRNLGISSRMAGEPFAGKLRIADGSGKPDPARMVADDFPYSVQLTKNLVAAVGVIILLILLFLGMNIGIAMMAVGFFGYAFPYELTAEMKKAISDLKAQCDIVVVYYHWGIAGKEIKKTDVSFSVNEKPGRVP